MAIDVAKLAIQLEAQGSEAVVAALEGLGHSAAGIAGAVAASAVAFEGLQKAMSFLEDSVNAAAENEAVYTRMGVAVTNAGENFAQAKPAIDAMLESLSANSTYRVDQLGEAFTRVVQLTGNVGKSMDAMQAITNLAAARNIDLSEAANVVGKALNGNATQLNRLLGLHGSAADAVAMLTTRYKDNAAALADTMGGAQAQASNAMHDLEETIGEVITNEGGAKDATQAWRDTLKDVNVWVKQHREELGNLVLGFMSVVRAVGEVISWVKYPLVGAWILVNSVIYDVIRRVENIAPTFKLMAGNVGVAFAAWLSELASEIPGLHSLLDGVIAKVMASSAKMVTDSRVAIAANNAAALEMTKALTDGDEPLEEHTGKIKAHTTAVVVDVAALEKELEALTKLSELNALTGPQFVKMEADYAALTKLVNAHTLGLDEQVKAEEKLAAARKAAPLLAGPQVTGPIVPQKTDDAVAKEQFNLVVAGIKKQAADLAKAQKSAAEDYRVSAAKYWADEQANIAKGIQDDVTSQFVHLGANLAGTIADTIGAAFEGGFKNAGQVAMKGIGTILSNMGRAMVLASKPMIALQAALSNPLTAGPAALAVGLLLMALGATLAGIASGGSGGGGGASSAASSIAGAGAATNAAKTTSITLSSAGTSGTSKLAPVAPVSVTLIGPNDGKAQRDLIALIQNAQGRGMKLGGA